MKILKTLKQTWTQSSKNMVDRSKATKIKGPMLGIISELSHPRR
jgi:hypothetical protein